MSGPLEAPELLDVQVDQLARMLAFIPARRLPRLQRLQPVEPCAAQDASHRRRRYPAQMSDMPTRQSLVAQLDYPSHAIPRRSPRATTGPARSVRQPINAFLTIPAHPLAHRPGGDPKVRRHRPKAPTGFHHFLDHRLSTQRRRTCILMNVHAGSSLKMSWYATTNNIAQRLRVDNL